MPKVYVADPGFMLATGTGPAETTPYELLDGHRVENAVWSTLVSAFGPEAVKYWRSASGAEIDFIVESAGSLLPVEVKFTGAQPREPVAMRNFRQAYTYVRPQGQPQVRPSLIISRDHIAVPETREGPWIIPAFLADFLKWGSDPFFY